MDKNIAALLDTSAVTIRVNYLPSSSTDYTYICNIAGVEVGDYVVVPVAFKAAQPMPRPWVPKQDSPTYRPVSSASMERSKDLMEAVQPASAAPTLETTFKVVLVVGVDKSVELEPNDDICYKWVVSKLDLTDYAATMQRNSQILAACAAAYKRNMRKSFAERILGDMDSEDRDQLLKLIAK